MALSFPGNNTPLINLTDGTLTLSGLLFFQTLYNRVGGAKGTGATSFLYPATSGSPGQLLTSQGSIDATTWTNQIKNVSQLTNDAGYVTNGQLDNQGQQTNSAIATYFSTQLSNAKPLVETTAGSSGTQPIVSRADHQHPRETAPIFGGQVTGTSFKIGNVTWTSGAGVPSGGVANGSIYSRTDGSTGARIYVSNGTTWTAIAGV